MDQGTKKIVKLLTLPLLIFLTLPAAYVFKIYYALKTHQPIMDENYDYINRNYDAYAKELDKHNRHVETSVLSSPESTLKPGDNTVTVKVTDLENRPVADSEVSLRFSRPATVNQDSNAKCVTDSEGICSMNIALAGAGPWEIRLHTKDAAGSFFKAVRTEIPSN